MAAPSTPDIPLNPAARIMPGWNVLRLLDLWGGVAAIAVTGALNVAVSFFFAFRLALRAHNVTGLDRVRIYRAIRAPLNFFRPARASAVAAPVPHG